MTMTDTAPAIVPNFGDEAEVDRKLVIICSKGNLDMAYPGLVLANAALGEGIETHLFFTFWGLDMILKSRMNDLQFTPVGNTAMHMHGVTLQQCNSLRPISADKLQLHAAAATHFMPIVDDQAGKLALLVCVHVGVSVIAYGNPQWVR